MGIVFLSARIVVLKANSIATYSAELTLGKTIGRQSNIKRRSPNTTTSPLVPRRSPISNQELADLGEFDEFNKVSLRNLKMIGGSRRSAAITHAIREMSNIRSRKNHNRSCDRNMKSKHPMAEAAAFVELDKNPPDRSQKAPATNTPTFSAQAVQEKRHFFRN